MGSEQLGFSLSGAVPAQVEPPAPPAAKVAARRRRSGPRTGYPRELVDYAAIYGYTDRQLKNWIRRGKEARPPEPPPLEDPPALLDWYQRVIQRAAPKKLRAKVAELEETGMPDGRVIEAAAARGACGRRRAVISRHRVAELEEVFARLSLERALARAVVEEEAASAAYGAIEADPDSTDSQVRQAQAASREARESARKLRAMDCQLEAGKKLALEVARAEWVPMIARLIDQLRGRRVAARAFSELARADTPAAWAATWDRLLAEALQPLIEAGFAEALELESPNENQEPDPEQ